MTAGIAGGAGPALAETEVLAIAPNWSSVVLGTPGQDEELAAVTVDPVTGDVVVVGYVTGSDPDALSARLDGETGAVRNTTVGRGPFLPPTVGDERAVAVAPTVNEASVATGRAGPDIVTGTYSEVGGVLWVTRFEAPAGGQARPVALAAGPVNAFVYVVGTVAGADGVSDGLVLVYGEGGRLQGSATFSDPGGGSAAAVDVAIQPDGSAVVTGNRGATPYTAAYLPDGTQRWSASYQLPGTAREMVLEPVTGNVYVLTGRDTPGQVLSYTPQGALRWASQSSGTFFSVDDSNLVLLPDGRTQVFGSDDFGAEDNIVRARRYDRDGQEIGYRLGVAGFGFGMVIDAVVDPDTGYTYALGDLFSSFCCQYANRYQVVVADGPRIIGRFTYGEQRQSEYPAAMTLDPDSDQLIVAGYTLDPDGRDTFVDAYPLLP